MLTINRRIFLFEFFTIVMFFCQYRIAKNQGYILFLFEVGFGCLCWLWSRKNKVSLSKTLMLYLFLIIYKIILTLLISDGRLENVRNLLYKELGMLFLCFFLVGECSSTTIIKKIRIWLM